MAFHIFMSELTVIVGGANIG